MKRTILTLIFISVLFRTYGQVETKFYPNKNALEQVNFIENHANANKVKTFPSFDVQKLINEDKLNKGLDIPFRFGKGFDTNITLNDGDWINIEGGRLWSMEFQSLGAYSINFVFNQFSCLTVLSCIFPMSREPCYMVP